MTDRQLVMQLSPDAIRVLDILERLDAEQKIVLSSACGPTSFDETRRTKEEGARRGGGHLPAA